MRNQWSFRIVKELRPTDNEVKVGMVINKFDEEGNNFYPFFDTPTTVALYSADRKIYETTKATADGKGTIIFTKRGLSDDGKREVSTFRLHRNPGTECYLTFGASDLVSSGGDNEWEGANVFKEVISAEGGVRLPKYVSLEEAIEKISNPYPGMQIVIDGKIWYRNDYFGQWEQMDTSTPVPKSTIDTLGLVMIANDEDVIHGNDIRNNNPVVVSPSRLNWVLSNHISGELVKKNVIQPLLAHTHIGYDAKKNLGNMYSTEFKVGAENNFTRISSFFYGSGAPLEYIQFFMSRTANYNKNTVIEIFDVDDTNIPKELIYSTTIPYTSLSVSKSSITIEITDITLENCKKYVVSFKQENDGYHPDAYFSLRGSDKINPIFNTLYYNILTHTWNMSNNNIFLKSPGMLETVVARARTNINANYNYLSFNLYYPVKNVDIGKNELLAKGNTGYERNEKRGLNANNVISNENFIFCLGVGEYFDGGLYGRNKYPLDIPLSTTGTSEVWQSPFDGFLIYSVFVGGGSGNGSDEHAYFQESVDGSNWYTIGDVNGSHSYNGTSAGCVSTIPVMKGLYYKNIRGGSYGGINVNLTKAIINGKLYL